MLRDLSKGQLRGLTAALVVSLVGAGFSAHAGLSGPHVTDEDAGAIGPARVGYEADDHFPGAAFYQLADDEFAAPTKGATGTVDLPAEPTVDVSVLDPTIRPAPPFQMRGTAEDKARALQCLTTAIYYEAASEPDDGQRAVAQVILNRVRHPTFPATVCGVIYQGSEKTVCQFSYACDGSMARQPSRAAWQRAARVAAAALAGAVFAPVGMATHYHTHAVTPSWNKSLVMTGVFGAHFFHRWKGYWGTGSAFTQVYQGGEPLPGPKAKIAAASVQPLTTEAAILNVPMPMASASPIPAPVEKTQPKPRESIQSGDILPQYDAGDESQILDKWKDSGKPIR